MIPCKPPTMSSSSDADREGHLPKPVGRAGPEVAEHNVINLSSPEDAERTVIDLSSDSEPDEKRSIPDDSQYDEINEEKWGSPKDSSSEHDEISEENRGSPEESEHDQTNEENRAGPEDGENDQIKLDFQLPDDDSPRTRVIYMLQEFENRRKDYLSKEEERVQRTGSGSKRADLKASESLMSSRCRVNGYKPVCGEVQGVEVGDRYNYRLELLLICLHRPIQGGIDCIPATEGKYKGKLVAVSVVLSGGYKENDDRGDTIIYTGQGKGEQMLEKGNLSLYNSCDQGLLVRVIRGERTKQSPSGMRYYYEGLYHVAECNREKSSEDSSMKWKYKLVRKANQRPRGERIIHEDLSAGVHEPFKVRVVGRLDDDRGPSDFEYISSLRYSPGIPRPLPATPCVCSQECRRKACACITLNGRTGYSDNGCLLWAETLIYECGPTCCCLPAKICTNRVAQKGLRFDMEVFKTNTKGWGVRCSSSIPRGSFVCEYLGEIISDTDAANRSCEDYLFDLKVPQSMESRFDPSSRIVARSHLQDGEDDANSPKYTVDANGCGNFSRFINHSCEPNLFVQCLLYDHHDRRFPHVMLFASEDIGPYDELTYDYAYVMDSMKGPNGEIKQKECSCGARACEGRMY